MKILMIVENINKLENTEFINIFKNIFEHSDFITHEVEGLRPFQNKLDVINSFIKVLIMELPKVGCLLYLSCILYDLI